MANEKSLNEILSIQWLIKNNAKLKVDSDRKPPSYYIFIGRILNRQLLDKDRHQRVQIFLQIMPDISRRTIYNWIACDFRIEDAYKSADKYYKEIDTIKSQEFILKAIDVNGEDISSLTVSIFDIEGIKVDVKQKPTIKVEKVLENREKKLNTVEPIPPDKIETLEEIGLAICEMFATGLSSIQDCCEKNNLNYLQFMELIQKSEYVRNLWDQSNMLANSFNNSRHQSMVNNTLSHILSKGYIEEVTYSYDKVIVPGSLEPIYVEKKKIVKHRNITPQELVSIKLMLNAQPFLDSNTADEFSRMTQEELVNFIKNKSGNINLRIEGAS